MVQEVDAAAITFTAKHLNSTTTEINFSSVVNGTLNAKDWAIKAHSCTAPCITNPAAVAGVITSDYAISNVNNGTVPSTGDTVTAKVAFNDAQTFNFVNSSDTIYLIHAAIPTDATYFINYTHNIPLSNAAHIGQFHEARLNGAAPALLSAHEVVEVGFNATAADWMSPTVESASIHKSNPNQIKFVMSENVVSINATANTGFSIVKSHGTGSDLTPSVLHTTNNTKFMYLDFKNTVSPNDVLTVSYVTSTTDKNWITDSINSERYITGIQEKIGNRLANYTGTTTVNIVSPDSAFDGNLMTNAALNVVNWLTVGMFGDVTNCYDCSPPTVTEVKVSLDSSIPIKVTNANPVQINAGIGDTVSVMVTVADNLGADTIPFAGLYTNFGETPDNLFYANNFDSTKQMSTSYYEWNVRSDDIAFANSGDITWNDATAKVNSDRTQTFTYTMTINDSIESSQVWVDLGDKTGNYAKLALPITLEVSGAPAITFASDDSQKVVSFFNESILLAIVSEWTLSSSDDASNVEQLSSVLGIEDQLPTWTTDLASWVAYDKIDVADMIVAVEYVINQ